MRNTSILVLGIAVILGLLAVAGVNGVLNGRSGAEGSNVAMTTVVIARKPLEFGNELTFEALQEREWPVKAVPDGSFTKISDVVGEDRRVALRSIAVGEPILKDKVSGFGGRAALSQVIAEGYRAAAVRVSDVSGAGGFILPGDRVDVLSTISPTNEKIDTVTNILIEDVRVLAIDQEADESTGGSIVAKAATLEVKPQDAQRIALASNIGTLSLSLRNNALVADDGDAADKHRPILYKDLGPAQEPAKTKKVARPAPVSNYTTMSVTRGVESSKSSVPRERATTTTYSRQSASRTTIASRGNVETVQSTELKITAPKGE